MAGRKLDLDSSAAEERDMEGRDEDEEDGWATPGKSETDDSEGDPTFDVIELTSSKLSSMSLRKSRSRASEEVGLSQLNDKEKKCFDTVEKMIKGGDLDKLKVEDCKSYLRKYGLRLTGNKNVLQARIEEHLQVMEGGGEKKYPISSFVLNCKGDACMGDVVMFEQNVYDMFRIASRSATGPPCGTRTVAGRIVKESYGAAKQQHTFTVEVLWSKGEKPLPPLHPLLIKGRNLYRLKTMRQRWNDEEERKRILQEKHRRGSIARCSRETRIQEKEMREVTRGKSRHRALMSEKPIAARAQNTRHQTLVSEKPIAAGAQNTGHQARASERPIAAGAHNTKHQACVPEKPIAFGAQNPWHQTLVSEKPIAAGAQNTGHRARVTEMPIAAGAQSTRHQACLPEKPIAVGAQNPWHEALVSENPMHQAPVSQKPIATEGHRNAIHHQNPEKCSDRTQCKQNGSSAQVMLPQASVTALPYLGVNHENDLALRNLHSTSRLNLPPKGERSHPDGSAERRPLRNLNSSPTLASPPLGNRVHSNHQDDTFYDGPQRNSKSSSTLGSPQHRYQLHGSHRDGFADGRRPLTDLGSSSILGVPPLGHRIHSNHQDHGFSHDWPRRSCNSSSGVGSQLHGHHHSVRRQPCHWYLQGRCWYGDDCRYLH